MPVINHHHRAQTRDDILAILADAAVPLSMRAIREAFHPESRPSDGYVRDRVNELILAGKVVSESSRQRHGFYRRGLDRTTASVPVTVYRIVEGRD